MRDDSKFTRHCSLGDLGELFIEIWSEEDSDSPSEVSWVGIMSGRSVGQEFQDLLYVVNDTFEGVKSQIRKYCPRPCGEC